MGTKSPSWFSLVPPTPIKPWLRDQEGRITSPGPGGQLASTTRPCASSNPINGTRPGGSQHVGDDPQTPHVRLIRDLVIIHHLGGQELRSPKIHLQLLIGVIPRSEIKLSEPQPIPSPSAPPLVLPTQRPALPPSPP
jgi:hypothetical protein